MIQKGKKIYICKVYN